jgi:phosphoribosylformimino-5-aminoimidazole carboxamide ribotide isomerase
MSATPIQIVPSIDLRGGRVVRLKQGDYGRQVTYEVDPFATARSFAEAGAQWMHLVDLDGARDGRPAQTELIRNVIRSAPLKVQVGGGIRSTRDVRLLLDAGAARVVVGTRAMEDWAWFEGLVRVPGMEGNLVLAIDAKDGRVATRAWTTTTTQLATDVARQVNGWPLGGLLYTDVSKDGMMQGPNLRHTQRLAEAGDVPVIASGGVGTIDHVRELAALPIWGAIVGRSLYEGTVDLRQAIAVANAVAKGD